MARKIQKKERVTTKLQGLLLFLVIFNLLAIPLYAILHTNSSFKPLQELNAKLLYGTMKIFGYDVELDGFMVYLNSPETLYKIEISWDSTGWKSMYAVAALIIATPVSILSKRMRFVAIGIAAIFALNYLRVLTTVLISTNFGFHLFDVVHTLLWREGLILGVVAFWFLWLKMEKYKIGKIKLISGINVRRR